MKVPKESESWRAFEKGKFKLLFLAYGMEQQLAKQDAELLYWKGVVRGCRSELHRAGLISDEEYAELCENTKARDYVDRNDKLREELEKVKESLADMTRAYLGLDDEEGGGDPSGELGPAQDGKAEQDGSEYSEEGL